MGYDPWANASCREEQALTDKKIEEEAQAIIEGRRRTRRKNRGDLMGEGSEDESDDEENEERRRRMARRMKKREDVEKLGALTSIRLTPYTLG